MSLPALLLQTAQSAPASGTGLEFMPILSFVLPAILLAVIMWYGSRHAV